MTIKLTALQCNREQSQKEKQMQYFTDEFKNKITELLADGKVVSGPELLIATGAGNANAVLLSALVISGELPGLRGRKGPNGGYTFLPVPEKKVKKTRKVRQYEDTVNPLSLDSNNVEGAVEETTQEATE